MHAPNFNLESFCQSSTYRTTRAHVDAAVTLPPDVYRRAELYDLEATRVFSRSWVFVGYTSQLDAPGKIVTTQVANQPIVITRDKEGVLRGFFNVCRHRGSLLVTSSEKRLERFRCPYHSWTYDLTGKLQNCPLFSNDIVKSDYHLLPIRVESWGCFVFVNLSENAEPLSDFLGDLPQIYRNFPLNELVLVRRKNYSINANWKLVAENFLEYYHLPWVHPELCTVAAIDMHKRNQGAGMYMSFYASPLLKGNTPLDADFLPAMPNLNEHEENSGYFPFVFPNLAMFLLPHHLFVLMMRPHGIDHTEEYADLLVHPHVLNGPDVDKKLDEMFAFYDMINMQDIVAVQRVQAGIQVQAYAGGRMCYRFEEPVHRFQNMWIDFMVDERHEYRGD